MVIRGWDIATLDGKEEGWDGQDAEHEEKSDQIFHESEVEGHSDSIIVEIALL
jgi:hypothetical protein